MAKNQVQEEKNMIYQLFQGKQISALGMGCLRLPMQEGTTDRIDRAKAQEVIDAAFEGGINYFDTAYTYQNGDSETFLGEALAKYPRERYYLATKFSVLPGKEIKEVFEEQLRRCRTDYFDFYLLHNVDENCIEEYMSAEKNYLGYLLEQKKAGRIRYLGFSSHAEPRTLRRFLDWYDQFDMALIQLNYLDWQHARNKAQYMQQELEKKGIPSVIMEPLLGGRLAKVPEHIADRLLEREPQQSIASWAFRFAGTHEGVLTVLSGMTYMEHLQDNLRTYSPLKPLTSEEITFLEEIANLMKQYPTVPCNDCKYCMPCPYGIDIPAILLHYNKCVIEGNLATNSGSDNYRKARRAYLVSYDRAVPKLRQANRCIGCNQCSINCPQKINIPVELHKIDRYIEKLKKESL
jgi:predicted aldo/keto reductase-like oxidoreductase